LPSRAPEAVEVPELVADGLGCQPAEVLGSRDYLAIFDHADDVANLAPDLAKLARIDRFGVIATAPGKGDVDFVSRFFAPGSGIPEDPVTGSAHCTLIPYWARRLGKRELLTRQISSRGGTLFCEDKGDRVSVGGTAALYLSGTIEL